MPRRRQYRSNADRQRAYRRRKTQQERHRHGGFSTVKPVPLKLVKVLGLLGSSHAGERANAAEHASRMLKEAGLTWYDVLRVEIT